MRQTIVNYIHISYLRYLTRAVLIPFISEVNFILEDRESVCQGFREAHFSLPTLLHIGSMLVDAKMSELQQFKDKILSLVPGISSRLSFLYSLLMFISEKVSMFMTAIVAIIYSLFL